MRWLGLMTLLLIVGYALSGVAMIAQDEVGIVRRFGAAESEPWQPGLHVGLPWPFDRVDRIKTGQTRTLTVGAPGPAAAPLSRAPDPASDDVLTGDLNVVTVQAILQYRIREPLAFLFTARSVEQALAAATESAVVRVMASRSIDDVLTIGRTGAAEQIAREIQQESDRLGLGISVRAVRLGRVGPPAAVAPAFTDAARARSDKRQFMTAAEEYRDRALADAAGRSREIADRAAARQDRAVTLAKGEADRFRKLLVEAQSAPQAIRRRLYLEALGDLVPRLRSKVVLTPGTDVDLGIIAEESEPSSP